MMRFSVVLSNRRTGTTGGENGRASFGGEDPERDPESSCTISSTRATSRAFTQAGRLLADEVYSQ